MPITRLKRLVSGVTWFDQWLDEILSAVERAINITASAPLQVAAGPTGISLAMAVTTFALAKSGVSGIPGRAGDNPGSGDVTLCRFDGTTLGSQPVTVKAYNLSATAVGTDKLLIIGMIDKYWFILVEVCN